MMSIDEPIGTTPWRVGRKVGRTLYDKNDRLCGVVDTPDIASLVVDAVNGFWGGNVEPPVIQPVAPPVALRLRDVPGLPEAIERELLKKLVSPVTTAANILDLVDEAVGARPTVALRPAASVIHDVTAEHNIGAWPVPYDRIKALLDDLVEAVEADRAAQSRGEPTCERCGGGRVVGGVVGGWQPGDPEPADTACPACRGAG